MLLTIRLGGPDVHWPLVMALLELRQREDWPVIRTALTDIVGTERLFLRDLERDRSARMRAALVRALEVAVDEISDFDHRGDAHRVSLIHPFPMLPFVGYRYRFGGRPMGGGVQTLMKSAHDPIGEDFSPNRGAPARFLADLSDPDRNFGVPVGVQDGWLNSEDFLGLQGLFLRGESVAMSLEVEHVRARALRVHEFSIGPWRPGLIPLPVWEFLATVLFPSSHQLTRILLMSKNLLDRVRRARPVSWAVLALSSLSLTTGCGTGPDALVKSSSHFSDAVRVAQSEQFLANLVRLRYRDVPVFLGVSSIATQFDFQTSADVSGTLTEGAASAGGVGLGVSYAERPTISFDINGGGAFQRRMLMPMSVESVALLCRSGWRVDRVFRVALERLNGLDNAPTASGPTPSRAPEYEGFLEAVTLMQRLVEDGVLDFGFEIREEFASDPVPVSQLSGEDLLIAADKGIEFRQRGEREGDFGLIAEERRLVLRFRDVDSAPEDVARLRSLLSLDPAARRVDVVPVEDSDFDALEPGRLLTTLSIETRSLEGMLYFLSNAVEVPEEDLGSGIVTSTRGRDGGEFDWRDVMVGLFRVGVSDSQPEDAAVAIQHRGNWFAIRDPDETSKSTFLLMRELFTLQAQQVDSVKPVLTLPVGR